MVFTIVTVIFLPLSFVAAFFAINVKEFPHPADANGQQEMSLSYVSAYVFGIGLAISLPCIAVALSIDECNTAWDGMKKHLRQKLRSHKQHDKVEEEDHEHYQTLPVEHTLSVARSLRRSNDLGWDSNQRRVPRKSVEISWADTYSRRRTSKPEWDVERGRHEVGG